MYNENDIKERLKELNEMAKLMSDEVKKFVEISNNPTQVTGKARVLRNMSESMERIYKVILDYNKFLRDSENKDNNLQTLNIEQIWQMVSNKGE